jgi:hypothetical protein
MISPSSIEALDQLYLRALADNCPDESGAPCQVTVLGDSLPDVELGQNNLIFLNISSYLFRLVNVLHFDDSPGLLDQLSRLMRSPTPLSGGMLADAHGEMANMICGAVNRGLCSVFRHAGMSTPLALGKQCLAHVEMLKPTVTRHYQVSFSDQARFWLSCSLHLNPGASFDFYYQPPPVQLDTSGELELF